MFFMDWNRNEPLFRRNWADLDSFFSDVARNLEQVATIDKPVVEIFENDDGALLRAELPGVQAQDLELSVIRNEVLIKGQRKAFELAEGETFLKRERKSGDFERRFRLGFEIDQDGVEATFEDGLLSVILPRAASEKPRKITLKLGPAKDAEDSIEASAEQL